MRAAARLAKLEGAPKLSYVEREMGRFERLLSSLDQIVAPSIAAAVRAELGLGEGAALLPKAAQELQRDLAFVSERADGGRPFSTFVHCLCTAP